MKKKRKIRALVLFSGGLDSILAVKILQKQRIEVTGLSFSSYFFDSTEAKKSIKQLGIKLIFRDISKLQIKIVKNPKYGYGRAFNPCIDCHGLMFRIAGKVAKKQNFDIVATGEILGQRPFSQNKDALKKVAKLAQLEGKILRPLSAGLLEPTIYEKEGLIDRKKLLDISGKNRQRQLNLIKKYGIEYFPLPAGGCRLTEKEFGNKVNNLLKNNKKTKAVDFELLRIGRHHWLILKNNFEKNKKIHIILGKNYEENQLLKQSTQTGDFLIELKDIMGPTALIVNNENKISLKKLKNIIEETKELILVRTKNKKSKTTKNIEWIIKSIS